MTSLKTELIVALDYSDPREGAKTAALLADLPVILKIGSELFLSAGPEFVKSLTSSGRRVFLDLKFHDIPNTVAKAASQAASLGVEMFTLHIAGGRTMIETVAKELVQGASRPKILGVSVLTSFDSKGWGEVCEALTTSPTTSTASIEDSVLSLAKSGAQWGLDGLVCSAHELERVQQAVPSLWTVVPGIRPTGSAAQDQARVMTPKEAQRAGANAIVVGRPITQANDPHGAALSILDELRRTS